jgi:phosphatidate phosphatase APP1
MTKLLPFAVFLTLFFGSFQPQHLVRAEPDPPGDVNDLTATEPPKPAGQDGFEVTFSPTYGALQDGSWKIPVRGWVHKKESEEHMLDILAYLACPPVERGNFTVRTQNFVDDSYPGETITIAFAADPEHKPYTVESNEQGVINTELTISQERAQTWLQSPQGVTGRRLAYHVVSQGAMGSGQVELIEAEGLSVISDIDDTIKVTDIPLGKDVVLRKTFCHAFVAAPGMAERYKEWSTRAASVSFHYVSGGPGQMYGPLSHFLITEQKFPEGTFHQRFLPIHVQSLEAFNELFNLISNPLGTIHKYKVEEINTLLSAFPNRKFILVGDSGEMDPEVYNTLRTQHPQQVQEIWIRDVVGDAKVNPDRLQGMTVIPVETPLCSEDGRFKSIKKAIEKLRPLSYARNPVCRD